MYLVPIWQHIIFNGHKYVHVGSGSCRIRTGTGTLSQGLDPHWFIANQYTVPNPDSVPNPGFWWSKIGKIYNCKTFLYFLDRILQFTYPEASIKDAHATGEAFCPQRRTSNTLKHENSLLFSIFVVHLLPSWIRIQQLKLMRIHPDPNPQPCFLCLVRRRVGLCSPAPRVQTKPRPPPPPRWS